jgi:hypothetical protein
VKRKQRMLKPCVVRVDLTGRSHKGNYEPMDDSDAGQCLISPLPVNRRRVAAWWGAPSLVLLAVTLSPLLWVTVPPLIDFPNHLARMSVLANVDPSAAVATNYVVQWRLVPNLAMDLVVPLLARIMSLTTAGRVFIAIIMIMLVLGTALLYRALQGRFGLWPICSLLFLYNDALAVGLVNYLFGLGVALLSFGLWLVSESWSRLMRMAAFAVIASGILVLHLFAFAVFGLLVGSYELGHALKERPLLVRNFLHRAWVAVQFIPAGVLWLVWQSNLAPGYTAQGSVYRKIEVWLIAPSFNTPPAPLDNLTLAFTVAFLIFGFVTRALIISPAMRCPIGAVMIAAIMTPVWASGTYGADVRLPIALPFIFIGATRLNTTSAQWPLVAFSIVGCFLLGLRITAVTLGWQAMDRQFAEFRSVIRALPEGARMMAVQSPWPREAHTLDGVSEMLQIRPRAAFLHLDTLAVIDRGAFVTDLFTPFTPVAASSRNRDLPRNHWRPLTPEELSDWALRPRDDLAASSVVEGGAYTPCCYDWPRVYDYVLWIDFGHPPDRLPRFLSPWREGSYFHIYRVIRP